MSLKQKLEGKIGKIPYFAKENEQIELILEGDYLAKFCVGRDSADIIYWGPYFHAS